MSVRGMQAAGLLLFPLIAVAAFEEVRDLRSARAERAIAARAARPVAVIAEGGVALVAADRAAARRALAQLLADRASAMGVRLATASIGTDGSGRFVTTDFVAVGAEPAVLRLIGAIESGRPAARLDRWTLTPATEGLRLAGRAQAVWQPPGASPAAGADAIRIPAPPNAATMPNGLFAPATTSHAGSGFPAELTGIVGRIAIDPQAMLKLANGTLRTVAIGESVAGWTLTRIDADRVHFRKGAEERTLVLPTAAE